MSKDRRHGGPMTRAEAKKPKLDFSQEFPVYRSEKEEQRE